MSTDGTVVCIASGPSLTEDDCRLVESSGHRTIVINSSWKIARFAEVLLAGDGAWWEAYGAEVDIPARRVCCSQATANRLGLEYFKPALPHWNSGMVAIWLAQSIGAERIVLLGYDCKMQKGLRHWHGDHDRTKNPAPQMIKGWTRNFARMPVKVPVVNATRDTAITRWPRIPLESSL